MCNLTVNKCTHCGKEFPKNVGLHKHQLWCGSKTTFLKKYNLSGKLNQEYLLCGSVLRFMEKFPYWKGHTQYYKLLKDFGVNVSIKASSNSEVVKKRRAEASILKHGVAHNFSKKHPSRITWEQKLLKEEGITNVFQRDSVKEKSLNTIIEKYGSESYLNTLKLHNARGKNVISSLNKKLFTILEELNISFSIECKLKTDKSYYAYDVLLENKKLIEINGDYWHGNPNIYKETDIILKGSSREVLVKDKWEHDLIKINHAKSQGYEVLVIWEQEIKSDIESVKNKILLYATN
jgi:very-short-patch-repair endonuclease